MSDADTLDHQMAQVYYPGCGGVSGEVGGVVMKREAGLYWVETESEGWEVAAFDPTWSESGCWWRIGSDEPFSDDAFVRINETLLIPNACD